MRPTPANLCACAAAALAFAGCGGEDRRDAGVADRTYTVEVERAAFLPRQRLAQRNALVISVRNSGDETIPNLAVTVRGFADRPRGPREADLGRDLWIVDREPTGTTTAFEDTWTAGRLAPGRTAQLRWEVTPVVAGTHRLTYEIAPAVAGGAELELASGAAARGSLTVHVSAKPARARVDPRTGAVRRQE
ncbi:MAG: hypothetical protein AVDCRST_MAG67-2622 [uncultured Solirubrobacteraceae bacterium]|uniref:Intracellular proteinase inhibitor BsuPI domain-containing protein n=1 Tax=uncultured Solirubrobacteraceae bacterium TaxID=1162706 RepID=A0A6J4SZQ6_9ACTN|nr:MAG: hypothetical protein AVDCRST_MAG67-2622 [uncultured Solirubrobacteraceae bacterium]